REANVDRERSRATHQSAHRNPPLLTMNHVSRGHFQDEKLAVKLTECDGALWLELTDRVAQRTWPATPLLKLEVHDKRLRREERIDKYRVESLEVWETGMHVTIND